MDNYTRVIRIGVRRDLVDFELYFDTVSRRGGASALLGRRAVSRPSTASNPRTFWQALTGAVTARAGPVHSRKDGAWADTAVSRRLIQPFSSEEPVAAVTGTTARSVWRGGRRAGRWYKKTPA